MKLPTVAVMCGATVIVPLLLTLAETESDPPLIASVSWVPMIIMLRAVAALLIVMVAAPVVLITTAEVEVGTA